MWITTKTIVKEIKKNQEDFAIKLNKIAVEQQESMEALHKQMSFLNDKIECIEKNNAEYRERNNSNYSEVMRLLEDINKLLNMLSNNLAIEFESGTQKMGTQIISSVQTDTKTILESIHKLLDNIIEKIEGTAGQCENHLKEEVKKINEYSVVASEKNLALIINEITSKFSQIETSVQEVSNESVRKTTDSCDAVSDELKNISHAIREMSALTEEQDKMVSENIASMSIAMQEVLKDLLALDEGNRLIIAKLLLKDMEI